MTGKDLTKLPDPQKHRLVSFAKSAIRIAAAGALVAAGMSSFHFDALVIVAGVGFIVAELLGVLEEVV